MAAQLLSFFRRPAAPRVWSAQELAEFYRVEAALIQAGLRVDSEHGLTDEGEPWFIFCRAEDDEVVIHFARIDGQYVISAPAYCGNAVGRDFRALVRSMIERHPLLRPKPNGNNLFLHPAAFLVMLVASALLKAGHAADATPAARQGTADAAADGKSRGAAPATIVAGALEAPHEALILAAIAATIAAPVQVDTITVVLPAAAHASDSTDQPLGPLTSALLLDKPHEPLPAHGSSMTPAASAYSQPAVATPVAVDAALTHAAPASDTPLAAASLITPNPQARPLFNTPSTSIAPSEAAADPAAGAQHVPLSALSDIPQADKVLLQALGVTDTAAYSPTPPDAFSTAIHAGVHIEAVSPQAAHASPAETAAPTAAPVPELSAVMASVLLFQAVEIQPVVLITDHTAIFYDAHAVTTALSEVKSVTYNFQDGFSISLVGLPAELAHAVIHV